MERVATLHQTGRQHPTVTPQLRGCARALVAPNPQMKEFSSRSISQLFQNCASSVIRAMTAWQSSGLKATQPRQPGQRSLQGQGQLLGSHATAGCATARTPKQQQLFPGGKGSADSGCSLRLSVRTLSPLLEPSPCPTCSLGRAQWHTHLPLPPSHHSKEEDDPSRKVSPRSSSQVLLGADGGEEKGGPSSSPAHNPPWGCGHTGSCQPGVIIDGLPAIPVLLMTDSLPSQLLTQRL